MLVQAVTIFYNGSYYTENKMEHSYKIPTFMHKQELLQKYLNNQCTPEEMRVLFKYLQEDDEAAYQDIMYKIWTELSFSQSIDEEVSERMFSTIVSGINSATGKKRGHFFFLQKPWKIAASVMSILVVAALLYFIFLFSPLASYSTGYGETRVVRMPDNTVVHLYANSKLSYPYRWEKRREVWLEGEGYFKVQKRVEGNNAFPQKFIVHTSNLDAEVVGTEFNVKDRRGNIQVILNSGIVKLTRIPYETQDLTIQPGDMVEVGASQQLTISKVNDPDIYSSWKDNELYFEDMTLASIGKELEDSHGIQLRFESDELTTLRFTGSTPVNDLSVLFTTLQKSFGLVVRQEGQLYIITKNNL